MSREALQQALELFGNLDSEELKEVNRILQRRLAAREADDDRRGFYQDLLESGLCLYVGERMRVTDDECPLIKVEGEPLSQTIIKERR